MTQVREPTWLQGAHLITDPVAPERCAVRFAVTTQAHQAIAAPSIKAVPPRINREHTNRS